MAVFVDTNVFVYWRDGNEASKRALAADWLSLLWREETGRTSCQVLSEYYVTVTRKLHPRMDHVDAWTDVTALMAWKPQETNTDVIRRAREIELKFALSWWDCQIVAAAQLQNCALLLTEDLQDGAVLGGVTVRNPFKQSLNQMLPDYESSVEASPRHPPRGRPAGKKRRASRA